jgi:hypothetical protein
MSGTDWNDALRVRVRRIVEREDLRPVLNDTKWRELVAGVASLPFPPAFVLRCVTDLDPRAPGARHVVNLTSDGIADVDYPAPPWHWGDWTQPEGLPPFVAIEWMRVYPRYRKHRGRLMPDEIIDETDEFRALLVRIGIPYQESDGTFTIRGYTRPGN